MPNHHRLRTIWDNLRGSYWFLPATMAVLAAVLSQVAIQIDESVTGNIVQSTSWLYVESPAGARAILSTIASSMITVAGIVFSLTMVVFSLSAQKYGSFVLANFMRDRSNQIVLGTFTAAFIYSLLVLRTIHGVEAQVFVPHLSVLIAVLLALMGVAVLIYFIHDVSTSVNAFTIIERSSTDLNDAIDALFPRQIGRGARQLDIETPSETVPEDFAASSKAIRARQSGYLQMIDEQSLLDLAHKHDAIIKLDHRPGDFVIRDSVLGWVWAPDDETDGDFADEFNTALIVGQTRSYNQDIAFHFQRLVEIAVRSLSPSVNDPFTAIMSIDRLAQALCRVSRRDLPSSYRYDDNRALRVIAHSFTFPELVDISFSQIRFYACTSPEVVFHLFRSIKKVGQCVQTDEARDSLRHHTTLLLKVAQECIAVEEIQHEMQQAHDETLKSLANEPDFDEADEQEADEQEAD